MAGSQISTSVTIINSLLGFQAMSLTNFDTSAESVIAAGSKIEIASAFFTFSGDDTPQATTWTAITTANTAYITLTPSGTAGSQIVTSKYSDTAPEWSDSKQGWYLTAASVIRYIGGVTKTSATQYDDAFILPNFQERTYDKITITDTATIDTLDVTDDMTVGGDATITGNVAATRGYAPQNTLFGVAITEDTIFDAMKAAIPNNGDKMIVSGGLGSGAVQTITSYVERISSTRIDFNGVNNGGDVSTIAINDGDGTQRETALAW